MAVYFSFRGQKVIGLCKLLVLLLIVLLLASCGDKQQSSSPDSSLDAASDSGTASAVITIQWHDAIQLQDLAVVHKEALDCEASGVSDVTCQVYDDTGALLVTGGPWPCANGGATIDGIQVGQNRMFVVLAEDAQGDIRYQGETGGITIEAGKIASGVVIDAFPFVPTLERPVDGPEGDPVDPTAVSLEWTAVETADQYLVQVAEGTNFNDIIVDEVCSVPDPDNPAYMPSNLLPSTAYYWKVSAVDINTNIGAASEVRGFFTSDCTADINPTSQSVAADESTYPVTVTTSFGNCDWTTSIGVGWISLSVEEGTGNGTVIVTVAANTGATTRNADITIAGQTHKVTQAAPPDTTDPTVSITSPTSNPTHSTEDDALDIGGSAKDDVAVTRVTWVNDRGGSGTCSGTEKWSAKGIKLARGDNKITVTAGDAAGNSGTDTLTVNYTPPDITDPTVSITSPTGKDSYTTDSSTVDIGGSAKDDVAVTRVTWVNDRGGNGTCSGTEKWSAKGIELASGDNKITVTASDAAGNSGIDILTVSYSAAPDAPELDSPANGAILDNGCLDRSDAIIWDFTWKEVPGATQYNIYVIHTGSDKPVIDAIVSGSSYHDRDDGAYITESNRYEWVWRVRAMNENEHWSDWSEDRFFNVEALDTDCMLY